MGRTSTLGIGLGLAAYGLFCVHDAAIKWLVVTTPVWQIMFFRSAMVLAGTIAIGGRPVLRRALTTPLKRALAGRSILMLTAWLCYYTAARSLPLGQLTTLYFVAPLIITVMAVRLLGESVTRARLGAVSLGFVGVMAASDPFGVTASWATLLVLTAAVMWAYGVILMRRIARQETSLLQMLFSNALFCAVSGVVCALDWHTPTDREWPLLLAVGVFGGLAQFSVFEAARFVPASVLATVEYSALLWAFLLGYVIWHDIPVPAVFAGAGLIVVAGLLLVATERRTLEPRPGK
jgi:drug/metabolite transporter (DMT)-like permease